MARQQERNERKRRGPRKVKRVRGDEIEKENRGKRKKEKKRPRSNVNSFTKSLSSFSSVSFIVTSLCPVRLRIAEDAHVNGLIKVNDNVLLRFSTPFLSASLVWVQPLFLRDSNEYTANYWHRLGIKFPRWHLCIHWG